MLSANRTLIIGNICQQIGEYLGTGLQSIMNVIYHRNCLDGTFSSLLVYLLSRIIDQPELQTFKSTLLSLRQQGTSNISHLLSAHSSNPPAHKQNQPTHKQNQPAHKQNQSAHKQSQSTHKQNQSTHKYPKNAVDQEFFHGVRGVPISTYSIFAGDYYPLKFGNGRKVLLILDTTLVSAQNIAQICQTHELVVLIDHHSSFKDMQQALDGLQIKNLVYLFDQNFCASELTLGFVDLFFSFRRRFQESFLRSLEQEIAYVSANDLKKHESRQSKSFVLGFYYFELQLSHLNPNLYKRVGTLDLSYLLGKGKNLYKDHLREIQEEVSRAKVCQLNITGFFKNKRCFYLQPRNHCKISDIGTVLAFLSASQGLLNLAVLPISKQYELRVSCRSHRSKSQPMALELSKLFNGGGHKQAAGFKLSMNDFRGRFKILSAATVSTKFDLTLEQIQDIFFGQGENQSKKMVQAEGQQNEMSDLFQ